MHHRTLAGLGGDGVEAALGQVLELEALWVGEAARPLVLGQVVQVLLLLLGREVGDGAVDVVVERLGVALGDVAAARERQAVAAQDGAWKKIYKNKLILIFSQV